MSAAVGREISFKLSSPADDTAGTGERTAATAANGKQHGDPRLLEALSHENKHNPSLSVTSPSLSFHLLSAQSECEGGSSLRAGVL